MSGAVGSRLELRDYVVVAIIGTGHYSIVYKAFLKKKKTKTVAIKVFKQTSDPRYDSKINQEVIILKKLNHKNIIKFIEYVDEDSIRYIVTEYYNGGTLKSVLHDNIKLSESVTRMILQQLVNGLNYLNSKFICHMDVKPDNILFDLHPPYFLKIADFGLSHDFSNSSVILQWGGTIGYMAPEKILDREYGLISDLWSVGIVIRECLTGRQLYIGYTLAKIKADILANVPIPDPTSVQLTVPCKDLLRSLLQYDPKKRLTLKGLNAHPFVDMNHEICPESFQKAQNLIQLAIKFDKKFEHVKSIPLYIEALQFLHAFVDVESNNDNITILNTKISEYERWLKILQKNPIQEHTLAIKTLPDIKGPWYENKIDENQESDLDQPGTSRGWY